MPKLPFRYFPRNAAHAKDDLFSMIPKAAFKFDIKEKSVGLDVCLVKRGRVSQQA